MELPEATGKAAQILIEERTLPTVSYELAMQDSSSPLAGLASVLGAFSLDSERKLSTRTVRENPLQFRFQSTNYDLLLALLSHVQQSDRGAFFTTLRSAVHAGPYSSSVGAHYPGWGTFTSDLPLVAEFCVRNGDKKMFIQSLYEAAISPGTIALIQELEDIVGLNFTVFSDDELEHLNNAVEAFQQLVETKLNSLTPQFRGGSFLDFEGKKYALVSAHEAIIYCCKSLREQCRKARYYYLKGALLKGMNLEINQDKTAVETYLKRLGFDRALVDSLNAAEKLYRDAASGFDFKSSMGHLRSFLEELHYQARVAVQKKLGGTIPLRKWGDDVLYLRTNSILTIKEEQLIIALYTLMSDTAVHPLIAEREYARLMRNVSIECGLLLLSKLEKSGISAS